MFEELQGAFRDDKVSQPHSSLNTNKLTMRKRHNYRIDKHLQSFVHLLCFSLYLFEKCIFSFNSCIQFLALPCPSRAFPSGQMELNRSDDILHTRSGRLRQQSCC